jgi:hypothetical protein
MAGDKNSEDQEQWIWNGLVLVTMGGIVKAAVGSHGAITHESSTNSAIVPVQ